MSEQDISTEIRKDLAKILKQIRRLKRIISFHPRAWKLMSKKKDFIVIADDEPYYRDAYKTIRAHEQKNAHGLPKMNSHSKLR